jgi:DnaJ-class molecular chaperone
METRYIITKETYGFVECSSCKGVGHKVSQFQGNKFKSTCTRCGGNKLEKITHKTEVSLQDALKEIGVIKA